MKAYVIKTEAGYICFPETYISDVTNDLREAFLFLTIEDARLQSRTIEGAKIIPIEIKETE